jgi:cytochrome c oxidase cbb3-type subunit III
MVCSGVPVPAAQPGEELFRSRCSGCHGLDGRGGEHAPDIATTASTRQLSDAATLRIIREGKPAAGMPAFRSAFDEHQTNALVEYLRILQGKRETAPVSGNSEKGRALFLGKGQCSECHMIKGQGGFIAADLSSYGETHPPDQISEAIANSGKSLAVLTTRDGKKYRGIVRNEDNFSLQFQALDGTFHFFDKPMLTSVQHEPHGAILSPAELDDLVSYLFRAQAAQR